MISIDDSADVGAQLGVHTRMAAGYGRQRRWEQRLPDGGRGRRAARHKIGQRLHVGLQKLSLPCSVPDKYLFGVSAGATGSL